ncbi:MAG: hypothetical protein GYA35_00580 [Thermoanaerobaculaceae bacterium]|nr:hypothetical protein [Thermoanaerobaculaceae bacterium]
MVKEFVFLSIAVFFAGLLIYANEPSKIPITTPDGLDLNSNTIDWLLSIGALRYGLSVAEIENILDQNKDNYCGIKVKVKPFDKDKDKCLKKKKILAHGKLFEGEYYYFEETPFVGKREKDIILAVENDKSSFALVRPKGSCYNQIIAYLPGDEQGMNELYSLALEQLQRENKHRKKTFKSDYIAEFEKERTSLAKWQTIEDNLYQFLQRPHTKEEIKEYCGTVLKDANRGKWLLKEYPYKLYRTETILDYLGCFKSEDFRPDTCISLIVDEFSAYMFLFLLPTYSHYDYDSERKLLDKEKIINYQISVFECFFKNGNMIGAIMKRHLTPFAEHMAFSALDMVFLTKSGMIFSSFCIENKRNHSLYGTFVTSYQFWKF